MAKSKCIAKQDIITTAEQLLSESVSGDVSLGDIAKAMNISKGTLYYHYSTREEVLYDITLKHMDQLKQDFADWLDRRKDDFTVDRFLTVVFYKGVKLFNRSKIHIFLLRQCMNVDSQIRQLYVDCIAEWRGQVLTAVLTAFGECRDCQTISDLIMMVIDGMVVREVLGIEYDSSKIVTLFNKFKY